jgi:serine/threonine protein phosphatase PrpC
MATLAQAGGRSPTFVVGSTQQQSNLDSLVRREQHLEENFQKNKPLCFHAKAYQKTHPAKAARGQADADVTLCTPMLLGVADGVSQMEDFGIDASLLPRELLQAVEDLSFSQLVPGQKKDKYGGPILMMQEAYRQSESLGSTTILTASMDNSTKIHGKLHPMIAVCSIGDCEILLLRRDKDRKLNVTFRSEMQRIDGNSQRPLQVMRVDEDIDPDYDERFILEVIERGSAVHCVSAFEADVVVMGSDGVFDNLFVEEIVSICNELIEPHPLHSRFEPAPLHLLGEVAQRLVMESHAKTRPSFHGYCRTPIGPGGKSDDTSCIVAQVVEWTDEHENAWTKIRNRRICNSFFTCGDTEEWEHARGSTEFMVDDETRCYGCSS